MTGRTWFFDVIGILGGITTVGMNLTPNSRFFPGEVGEVNGVTSSITHMVISYSVAESAMLIIWSFPDCVKFLTSLDMSVPPSRTIKQVHFQFCRNINFRPDQLDESMLH